MSPARLLFAAALIAAAPASAQSVVDGIRAWQAENYDEAVRQWRPLAERGDADAQFNLGHAYRLGRGVERDMRMAERHYEHAARQGHSEAQAMYGLLLFQNGRRREAMPWIEQAAEQGDPRARYVLGTALFNGDLVEADLPRAFALMQRAAADGLPQAEQQLRLMEPHLTQQQRARGAELAAAMASAATAEAAPPPVPARPSRVAGSYVHPTELPPSVPAAAEPPRRRPDTPAVRPAPAPAAAAPAPAGRWRVQLGAFSSEANARRHWQDVGRQVGALAGLQPRFERAGALTRLQAAGLPDRAAAERVCAAVKAAGKGCFAVAP